MLQFEFYHFGVNEVPVRNIKFVKAVLVNGVSEMSKLIKKNEIDLVYVGSIWRETFNFVAYESAEAGAALLALEKSGNVKDFINQFDIGATGHDVNRLVDILKSPDFELTLQQWQHNLKALSMTYNKSIFTDGVM